MFEATGCESEVVRYVGGCGRVSVGLASGRLLLRAGGENNMWRKSVAEATSTNLLAGR
jgi:hypothetical protein